MRWNYSSCKWMFIILLLKGDTPKSHRPCLHLWVIYIRYYVWGMKVIPCGMVSYELIFSYMSLALNAVSKQIWQEQDQWKHVVQEGRMELIQHHRSCSKFCWAGLSETPFPAKRISAYRAAPGFAVKHNSFACCPPWSFPLPSGRVLPVSCLPWPCLRQALGRDTLFPTADSAAHFLPVLAQRLQVA